MNQYLRYVLPLYVALYFIFLMLIRMITIRRQIGKNPIVLATSDDAHGLIAMYFKLWMVLLGVYAAIVAIYPPIYARLMPMIHLESDALQITGLIILSISLIWTYIAQAHMRTSWRVGIDQKDKTELVTDGIFHWSRNPIYLGMIASMAGLFLVTPNVFTMLLAIVGFILVQVQVRLEEDFLYKSHGEDYLKYKRSVRRFI
ncbi:MAG: putative transrane protein of unknown function [Bacteroidetes bacterium]|nr:putative transrane protein of unknown function [Bacteroidota bacterium]